MAMIMSQTLIGSGLLGPFRGVRNFVSATDGEAAGDVPLSVRQNRVNKRLTGAVPIRSTPFLPVI
jgi:hypothetical protein